MLSADYNRCFRRDGTAYPDGTAGTLEWAREFEDPQKRSVDRTYTIYGELVSTVWMGLNHNYVEGPPLIFETMVRSRFGWRDLQLRYSTESQAHRGHVKVWFQTLVPPSLRHFCFEEWR